MNIAGRLEWWSWQTCLKKRCNSNTDWSLCWGNTMLFDHMKSMLLKKCMSNIQLECKVDITKKWSWWNNCWHCCKLNIQTKNHSQDIKSRNIARRHYWRWGRNHWICYMSNILRESYSQDIVSVNTTRIDWRYWRNNRWLCCTLNIGLVNYSLYSLW